MHHLQFALCFGILLVPPPMFGQMFGPEEFIIDTHGNLFSPVFIDMDDDGYQDLMNCVNGNPTWRRNLNGQSFGPTRKINTNFTLCGSERSWASDVDGDGHEDLILADLSQGVHIYFGNGAGGFAGGAAFTALDVSERWSVTLSDIDGNGREDVIVLKDGRPQMYGQWAPRQFSANSTMIGAAPTGVHYEVPIVMEDMDLDGNKDLLFVTDNGSNHGLRIYYLNGSGVVLSVGTTGGGTGVYYSSLAVFDMNGDGYPDVFREEASDGFRMLQTSPGIFGSFSTAGLHFCRDHIAVDMDGDGNTDVFGEASSPWQIGWNRSLGNGSFQQQVLFEDQSTVIAACTGPDPDGRSQLVADGVMGISDGIFVFSGVNGVTRSDIIAFRSLMSLGPKHCHPPVFVPGASGMQFFQGGTMQNEVSPFVFQYDTLTGKFGSPVRSEEVPGSLGESTDWDQNGLVDPTVVVNDMLAYYPAYPDSIGARVDLLAVDEQEFRVHDIDGDGDADLVVDVQGFQVFINAGNGTFFPALSFGNGADVGRWQDLNDDGTADLIRFSSLTSSVYADLIDLNLQSVTTMSVGGYSLRDAIGADTDGDGQTELLVSWENPQPLVKAFERTGTTLGNPVVFDDVVPVPRNFGYGDLDGDGDDEIVAVSGGPQDAYLMIYRAEPTGLQLIEQQPMEGSGDGDAIFNIEDVDGDGLRDVFLTRELGNISRFSFFRNTGQFPVSVAEAAPVEASSLRLLPNPTNGTVTLRLSDGGLADLEQVVLRDGHGRVLHTWTAFATSSLEIDLGQNAPGCYLVEAVMKYGGVQRARVLLVP